MDQSLLAAPHGLSQRVTSFIASQRQGIHQMPLETLDQTVRKGKCRWPKPRIRDHVDLTSKIAGLLTTDGKAPSDATMQSHGLGCLSLTLSNSVPGGSPRTGIGNWFIHVQFLCHPAHPRKETDGKLVGTGRFELPTSRLSVVRSNQLSYAPVVPRPNRAELNGRDSLGGGTMRYPPLVFP